jgi:hypothetical protein
MKLLTLKEVCAQLSIGREAFLKLHVPMVELSPRKYRYRQEDIDDFVRSRLTYAATKPEGRKQHGRRLQARQKEVGIPEILSWREVQKICVEHEAMTKKKHGGS